jgi:hypothetical protein
MCQDVSNSGLGSEPRRAVIAPKDSQARFEALGVDVFRGEARFASPRRTDIGDQFDFSAQPAAWL